VCDRFSGRVLDQAFCVKRELAAFVHVIKRAVMRLHQTDYLELVQLWICSE